MSLVANWGHSRSLLALAFLGCGTQYADPIVAPAGSDPCSKWLTQVECIGDTANGCRFQPNRVGCLSSDASCGDGQCRGGDPFVQRSEQALFLHDAPYRFVGAVSWSIAGVGAACRISSPLSPDEAVNRAFDQLTLMKATVLKIWAFQRYAGPSGEDFDAMDRVVAAARRAGVRLIPVLENMWADCTQGGEKTDAWFASGYLSPYGDYALSYPEYVSKIVSRYRDEPTILAWELMHEAWGTDFAAMNTFVNDMVVRVRELDKKHLIVVGLDGGDSSATSRAGVDSYYKQLQDHEYVDLIDVHDYAHPTSATIPGLAEQSAIAQTLKKPWFLGAVAVTLTDETPAAYQLRATQLGNKMDQSLGSARTAGIPGGVGFLVYDYELNWSTLSTAFDGRSAEPLAGPSGVIANHAIANP